MPLGLDRPDFLELSSKITVFNDVERLNRSIWILTRTIQGRVSGL